MTDLSDAHTEVVPLKGRRVLVTGGTTGIGRAIAVLLASEGARVFVCGRNPDHLADNIAAASRGPLSDEVYAEAKRRLDALA